MKKYHKRNPHENIWILGLPAGSPPQAALSLLPKGSKIISVTLPEWTEEDEKKAVKHRMAKPPELD